MDGRFEMDPALHEKFVALLREEGLVDASWIVKLDDIDEPPLFTRLQQVEFLRHVPEQQRVTAALQIALEVIDRLANEAAQGAPNRTFFMCATLSDFDDWRAGEQPIPTPAILVNPNEGEPQSPSRRLVGPHSEDAIAVASWLAALGRDYADRYCVGELSGFVDPDLKRVYVGWRTDPAPNIRSVGSEIRSA